MSKTGTMVFDRKTICIELLIVLLPFLSPKLQVFDTAFSKILILFTLILTLLIDSRFRNGMNSQFVFVWIYSIVVFLILAMHNDYKNIIFVITDQIGMLYLGYYYVTNSKDIDRLLKILIIPASVLGGLGIYESIFDVNLFDRLLGVETIRYAANAYRFGFARAYTSFTTSINFCTYLGLIQILVIFEIYQKKIQGQRTRYLISLIVVTMAMIFTFSRGALLATLFVDFILLCKMGAFKKVSTYLLTLLGIVLFLLLIAISNTDISDFFYALIAVFGVVIDQSKFGHLANKYGYGNKRQSILLIGWVLGKIRSNPLFGVGMKQTFSVNINQWVKKTSIENEYLYVLYTTGWVGLANRLMLYGMIAKRLKASRKSRLVSYSDTVFWILLLYLLSLCVVSTQDEGRILFFIIGTGLAYKISCTSERGNDYEENRSNGACV